MKRWLRFAIKSLIIVTVLVLMMPLVVVTALQSDQVRSLVLQRILGDINETIEGTISVDRVEGTLIGHGRLHGVRIVDGRGNLAAEVDRADVDFQILPLLRSSVVVDEVNVDGVTAVLRFYDDEEFNWLLVGDPEEDPEPEEPLEWQINVEKVDLVDGAIAYFDETIEADVEDPAAMKRWRDEAIENLDQATSADELRELWSAGFAGISPAEVAGPRAPTALWFTDLELGGDFRMLGEDLQARITRLSAESRSDILPDSVPTEFTDVALSMGATSMLADVDSLVMSGVLEARDFQYAMTFPPSPGPADAGDTESPEGFDHIFIDIGRWTVEDRTLKWAAPDLNTTAPLYLEGKLAFDPERMDIIAAVDHDGAETPVKAALRLHDYGEEVPSYELSLIAEDFSLQRWLLEPEIPSLDTSIYASGEGRGFELDDVIADVRIRLDDTTVDETYELDMVYASLEVDGGVIDAPRIAALSPYVDLFASAHFDPEGQAMVRARTSSDATQAERAAALSDMPQMDAGRADLELDIDAHFDPDADELLASILDVDASVVWDLSEFSAEDLQIGDSSGEFSASLEREHSYAELTYGGEYRVRATGRNIRYETNRVGYFHINDRGTATISPTADNLSQIVRRLQSNAELGVRNLRTPELQISAADLSATTRKTDPRSQTLSTALAGNIANLQADGLTANQLQLSADTELDFGRGSIPIDGIRADVAASSGSVGFDGSVADDIEIDFETDIRVGQGQSPFEFIRRFELIAAASASAIDAPDYDIRSGPIEAGTTLEGTLDDPVGQVQASIEELSIGDEDITQAIASVTLAEERRRGHARLDLWRAEDEPYRLRTDFSFDAAYEAFEISGLELATDHVTWSSPTESKLRWTGVRAEAEEFFISDGEQSIAIDGHFHPDVDQDLRASIDIDVEEFLDGLYLHPLLPDVEGKFDVEVVLQGTSQQPEADLIADLSEVEILGFGIFDSHVSVAYADERLRVRHADLTVLEQEIFELSGLVPVALDLDGNTEFFADRHSELIMEIFPQQLRDFHEPVPMLNNFGIDGEFALDLDWSGTLDEPVLDLEMTLEEFQFQGEIGEDFVALREIDSYTQLSYEAVAHGGDGLDLTTVLRWEDETAAELGAQTQVPLEEWLVAFLDGEEDFVHWESQFLELPFVLRLQTPSFDLERIPMESLREQDLAGTAEIDIELAGTIADPEGHVELDLEEFGWRQFRDFYLDIDADLREQQIAFERMDLTWGDHEIFTGAGMIPLPLPALLAGEQVEDLPFDFRWEFHDLPVSRFSAIDYEFARIRGYLAASVALAGSLRSPRFVVEAGLFDTRLGDGSDGSIEMQLSGREDVVALGGELTRNGEPFLTFDGQAPVLMDVIELSMGEDWQLPGDLRFEVASNDIELAEVVPTQLLTNYILDPEGNLSTELIVGGDWEEPTVAGFFELADGAVTLPEYGRGFADINGRIEIDDDHLNIDDFEIHDGPSSVHLAGTVEHDLLIPGDVDLELNIDEFNIGGIGTDFPLFVTAETTATGDPLGDPGELNVHITNLEVRMTDEWDRTLHDTALDPDIVLLEDGREPMGALAQFFDEDLEETDGLNLVVNISIDRNAWARHPAGDINFQADMSADIAGTVVAITGTVDVLRGDLEFLGRRFEVQESEVTFTGNIPPDPRLRIEAHHQLDRAIADALGPPSTGEPRIIFRVSGTAEQPRLQLQADPAMNDTEILFVLMTGRPPDRTDVGRDEGVAAQALSAVSGVFLGMLQDELAGRVPVDVLRLEPAVPGTRGGRLEVGTYLSSDAFFSWRHQFGADEDIAANVFRLEYHFLPRWMVETVYTDRNEGEFNLFWDAL